MALVYKKIGNPWSQICYIIRRAYDYMDVLHVYIWLDTKIVLKRNVVWLEDSDDPIRR